VPGCQKITNDNLTRSGTGCFRPIAVPNTYGNSGHQRVNLELRSTPTQCWLTHSACKCCRPGHADTDYTEHSPSGRSAGWFI